MGGGRYTPEIDGLTFEDVLNDPYWEMPLQEDKPFEKKMDTNVGYAFSMKYTINKERVAHHFILEYLNVKSFEGRGFNRRTNKIVDYYTSLTFPNVAYRIEFWEWLVIFVDYVFVFILSLIGLLNEKTFLLMV